MSKTEKHDRKTLIARWVQVIATFSLGLVGIYFTRETTMQLERSSVSMSAMQLMSARENSEMSLRQEMFTTVTDKILNKEISIEERIATFELFQHNFHDVFNGRPLFDLLAKEGEGDARLKQKLVRLANEVKRKQVMLVGEDALHLELKQGEEPKTIGLWSDPAHQTVKHAGHSMTIELVKIDKNSDSVQIKVVVGGDDERVKPFKVSFFDAPLTDNTLLSDGHRFAVMLDHLDRKKAEVHLSVLHFPAYYVTMGHRPSLRETQMALGNALNSDVGHRD